MAKPKAEESKAKTLPDLAELKIDGWESIILKLEKLHDLQEMVGQKPDDKKGKEGSGLLRELNELKRDLSAAMAVAGVEGLRHNNLVFTDCWIDGRETVDMKTLAIELAQDGVPLDVIKRCIAAATKTGDGYVRRQLVDLNNPRGGKFDD